MHVKKLNLIIISGTNREGAYSLKYAEALKSMIGVNHEVRVLDLAALPVEIFSSTSYLKIPQEFISWQEAVIDCNGLVICVPEYNGGIPGILKYFIDMLEYPKSLQGKPVALIGLSAGLSGAKYPINEVSIILSYLKANIFNEKIYISKCQSIMNEDGVILNQEIYQQLKTQTHNFIAHCLRKPTLHTKA